MKKEKMRQDIIEFLDIKGGSIAMDMLISEALAKSKNKSELTEHLTNIICQLQKATKLLITLPNSTFVEEKISAYGLNNVKGMIQGGLNLNLYLMIHQHAVGKKATKLAIHEFLTEMNNHEKVDEMRE